MKKSAVLLLIALSTGLYLFLLWYRLYTVAPLLKEEVPFFDQNTLLVCKNVRTLHAKNELGSIKVEALQGLIEQNQTLKATSIFINLQPTKGKIIAISAEQATLPPDSNIFFLSGNVHIKQNTTSLCSAELSINKKEKSLVAKKNVLLKSLHGTMRSNMATISLKDNTVFLDGNVSSVFNSKHAHKPRQ